MGQAIQLPGHTPADDRHTPHPAIPGRYHIGNRITDVDGFVQFEAEPAGGELQGLCMRFGVSDVFDGHNHVKLGPQPQVVKLPQSSAADFVRDDPPPYSHGTQIFEQLRRARKLHGSQRRSFIMTAVSVYQLIG